MSLLPADLETYIHEHTQAPTPLPQELRERTYSEMEKPLMQIGRVEGALLRILVAATGAYRILEITGHSVLIMTESLPDHGELITGDRDPMATERARSFFERWPHGRKIQIRPGPAPKPLKTLSGSFELIVRDADKDNDPA